MWTEGKYYTWKENRDNYHETTIIINIFLIQQIVIRCNNAKQNCSPSNSRFKWILYHVLYESKKFEAMKQHKTRRGTSSRFRSSQGSHGKYDQISYRCWAVLQNFILMRNGSNFNGQRSRSRKRRLEWKWQRALIIAIR